MSALTDALYDHLLTSVRSRLPGAIDGMIKHEMFFVLDDFLQYTNAWREDIRLRATRNRTDYEFESSEGTIITLIGVVNDNDIPVRAAMPVPGQLKLLNTPQQTETLFATVSLTVVHPENVTDFPEIPDWLLQKYCGAILDGLLAAMLSQPAKPYTDFGLAGVHSRLFAKTKAEARGAFNKSNLFGGQRWRYPQNFATGRR